MKTLRTWSIVATMVTSPLLTGCEKDHPVASPACVELNKTTDPVRRQELQKQCPRGGGFKRSSGIQW